MRKVVVSGGLGFIGSEFINLLLDADLADKIIVIDKETYAADINRINFPDDGRLEYIKKDICKVTKKDLQNASYVVNFAAETHVDNSIKSGRPFIRTNVEGTFNLIEKCRDSTKLKKFVQISTDEVYGDMGASNKYAADEGHPLRPSSYYSATKTAADLLVLSAHRTYGLPYLITRSCNNFGPKQDKEKFLPTIFNSIKEGKKVPVYGDGKQIREWISVDDNVRNIAALMLMKSTKNSIVNIGSGFRYHNIDIVKMIGKFLGKEVEFEFVKDRLGHDFKYALDCSKLRAIMPDLIYTALETFLEAEAKKCQ